MTEDARIISIKKIDEEQLTAEPQAGADRESRAEAGRAVAQSETDRVTREAAGERVNARAEADCLKLANDAQTLAAQTEADRLRQENDAQRASAQTDRIVWVVRIINWEQRRRNCALNSCCNLIRFSRFGTQHGG